MATEDYSGRKNKRMPDFDYSKPGFYFITICTKDRENLLGQIVNNKMILNNIGEIAQQTWADIPIFYSGVDIDEFQIMPNHVHGIIEIRKNVVGAEQGSARLGFEPKRDFTDPGRAAQCTAPTMYGTISKIIKSFKETVTKTIKEPIWQRSFYDCVIRKDGSLERIRQYIIDNPANWGEDIENANPEGAVGHYNNLFMEE